MYVLPGLLMLIKESLSLVKGRRVGLITHPAAVLPDLTSSLDALLSAGVELTTLFGPEHGFWGCEADAEVVEDTLDKRTDLHVYSLYGKNLAPTADMLSEIDILIFDIQDIGVRFYTYISTLFHVLSAAGKTGKSVILLDRPNPITGKVGQGPQMDADFCSFVGIIPIPIVHGLTIAEMAVYMNVESALGADLMVVPMQNWKRDMWFDMTGLPWVTTSPGIPHFSTAVAYPCTCFFEGTNVSEGRGTPLPFEVIGAPWIDGYQLARYLNQKNIPGMKFRPVSFTPSDSKYKGERCHGVQVHILERNAFQPVYTALHLLESFIVFSRGRFRFLETSWEGKQSHLDLLFGTSTVRSQLEKGVSPGEISAQWVETAENFDVARHKYLLYQ
ncbi:MAG: DUF1343 domain-containing protein [Anaerolineaceae bacterium]|nr:DUF1343 domain-containing protein [Anaerolineaceae bacterium]